MQQILLDLLGWKLLAAWLFLRFLLFISNSFRFDKPRYSREQKGEREREKERKKERKKEKERKKDKER